MNSFVHFSATVFGIGASSLLLTACDAKQDSIAPTLSPVMVSVVQLQNSEQSRKLSANVAARDETNVAFRASGRVSKRLVEVGQRVTAGQVLATIDPKDYELAVAAAADQMRAAQVDAAQQRVDAERLARLANDGSVGSADKERQKARADAAQALQQQSSRQLALAKNRVQYTTLLAPFSGVITAIQVEAGQVVSEGQPVLMMARTDQLDIVADIPEQLATDLAQWPAQVSLWNDPSKRYTVRLRELSPMANPQTRTFKARFSGAPNSWKLGMTAQLFLQSGQNSGSAVATLPATALIQRGQNKPFVWKVLGNKLQAQPVQIVSYQQEHVVLQGLKQGEQIVSVGAQKLDAGMQVRAIVREANPQSEAGIHVATATLQGKQP